MALSASDIRNLDPDLVGFSCDAQLLRVCNDEIADDVWNHLRNDAEPPAHDPDATEPFCLVIDIRTLFIINDKKTTIRLRHTARSFNKLVGQSTPPPKIALVCKRNEIDRLLRIAVGALRHSPASRTRE